MNQNFSDLKKLIDSIDEETIEKLVIVSGIQKSADTGTFSRCALYLQGMYLNIVHADQHPSMNIRQTVNRELTSLLKNLGNVRSSLNQTSKPDVFGALQASSIDLNFRRAADAEAPVQFKTTIEELHTGLTTIAGLIEHFFDPQDAFDKTKPSFLLTEILLKDERVRIADASLNPYFRKPLGVSATTTIVRTIGMIYNRLFKTSFSVTTKWKGPVRYSGPAMDFAYTAVTELQLQGYFKASSQADLINKIGDAWTNDKRRKKAVVQSGSKAPSADPK
jgi:hypothetical protein